VASIANKEGLCPLHEACRYHANEEVIEVLLEAYPDALRIPIKKGNPAPRKCKTIADRKDGDHVIVDGTRRLSGTVTDLRFEATDQQIRDGAYPLHMAIASKSSKAVVEMLMLAAPEVLQMTNKFGETPLHVSMAVNADTEIVELLLHNREDLGALAMADNVHGNLPLHLAAIHGCQDGVAILLLTEYPGASKVKNAVGKTPLDLARECNHSSSDFLHLLEREATSPRNVVETSATLKWPDDSAD
jgi:ankyrin repeat protein